MINHSSPSPSLSALEIDQAEPAFYQRPFTAVFRKVFLFFDGLINQTESVNLRNKEAMYPWQNSYNTIGTLDLMYVKALLFGYINQSIFLLFF